ncbi:MAG: glycosyltransferase family 2 protein, partial [Bacteroides sp.]|nr:glycosyltransferase family 2 protein [Bacteroides sp.]
MNSTIHCFIPFAGKAQADKTIRGLRENSLVGKIYLLATEPTAETIEGCEMIRVEGLQHSSTLKAIAERSDAPYSLIYTKYT